ncbi:unnamed protein product, partial [Laminaria digitata]
FLHPSSLKRLGILYLTTCVGFGYGFALRSRIFLRSQPTCLNRDNQRPDGLAFSYGNINPFPIDYAFQPRLRGRLTLPRLTLDRNPWSFGVRVFHSHYRYSCQHSHF